MALLLLFATGAYMVATRWAWNVGWIDAAIGGVVVLFIGGGFLDSRVKALARAVEGDPATPVTPGITQKVRDPLRWSVSFGETGLAIGIVFNMANKPPRAGALAALILATAIGVVIAIPLWRAIQVRASAQDASDASDAPRRNLAGLAEVDQRP